MREAAIKRQEQELKIREAALKNKKDVAEPSLGHDRKGMLGTTLHPVEQCNRPSKLNSLRHVRTSGGPLNIISTEFYTCHCKSCFVYFP